MLRQDQSNAYDLLPSTMGELIPNPFTLTTKTLPDFVQRLQVIHTKGRASRSRLSLPHVLICPPPPILVCYLLNVVAWTPKVVEKKTSPVIKWRILTMTQSPQNQTQCLECKSSTKITHFLGYLYDFGWILWHLTLCLYQRVMLTWKLKEI